MDQIFRVSFCCSEYPQSMQAYFSSYKRKPCEANAVSSTRTCSTKWIRRKWIEGANAVVGHLECFKKFLLHLTKGFLGLHFVHIAVLQNVSINLFVCCLLALLTHTHIQEKIKHKQKISPLPSPSHLLECMFIMLMCMLIFTLTNMWRRFRIFFFPSQELQRRSEAAGGIWWQTSSPGLFYSNNSFNSEKKKNHESNWELTHSLTHSLTLGGSIRSPSYLSCCYRQRPLLAPAHRLISWPRKEAAWADAQALMSAMISCSLSA